MNFILRIPFPFPFLFLCGVFIVINSHLSLAGDKAIAVFKNKSPQNRNASLMSPVQQNAGNQPILKKKAINKLPSLSFDGNDFMNYDGSSLANSDYTIFIVEKRGSNKANNYFFGTTNSNPNANEGLIIGYKTEKSVAFLQGSREVLNIPVEGFINNEPARLHVFVQDSLKGKRYYRNGLLIALNNTDTNTLLSNNNSILGGNGANYFNGDIAEIAIYRRALLAREINPINDYLIAKWNITRIKENTFCTPNSQGYVNDPNIQWSNYGNASSGSQITSSCKPGYAISGTVGPLTCNNGVYSGVTSGSCLMQCTTNPNTSNPITYGGGTWNFSGAVNSGITIAAICPFGSDNPPTITCNNGVWTANNIGNCKPRNCPGGITFPNFPVCPTNSPNCGTWSQGTAWHGFTTHFECSNGSGRSGRRTTDWQCCDGSFYNIGECSPTSPAINTANKILEPVNAATFCN